MRMRACGRTLTPFLLCVEISNEKNKVILWFGAEIAVIFTALMKIRWQFSCIFFFFVVAKCFETEINVFIMSSRFKLYDF